MAGRAPRRPDGVLGAGRAQPVEQWAARRAGDTHPPTALDLVRDEVGDTPGHASVHRLRDV